MKTILTPTMQAFFLAWLLPAPGRKHRFILNKFLNFKGEISALEPGIDGLVAFYIAYYKMKHDLNSYYLEIASLIRDLRLLSGETIEGMQRYEDIETIKMRVENNCHSVGKNKYCCLAPGVSDFTDIKPHTVFMGNIYGLSEQSLTAWKKGNVDIKTHNSTDALFATMSDYQLLDYYVSEYMKQEIKSMVLVTDRTLTLL
jgi:hypothetical protein